MIPFFGLLLGQRRLGSGMPPRAPRTLVLAACALLAACSDDAPDNPASSPDAASDAPVSDSGSDAACTGGVERNGPYSLVTIVGNPGAKGAIDPSVVYAEGAEFGLMTYTTVPDEAHDHIAIATSTDSGATWTYTANVTTAGPVTIPASDNELCGAPTCTGTFIHESSSLVLDPTDPNANRRLKVFVHSYFFGIERHLRVGYLAMYTAATPAGPWNETKLFGWSSESPISNDGVVYEVQTDPGLPEMHDCFIVGEPGVLFRQPGILDLTLSCPVIAATGATIDVRLLRSHDHGATWTYVSTLLTADDALSLGSTEPQINGSALLSVGDRHYVIASPSGEVDFPDGPGQGYRGCVVVPIADIEAGAVERCGGEPVVTSAYLGQPGQFVGACSGDVGATDNGMLIPVPDFSTPGVVDYRIYAAGLPLP
jgi:hypothetical protein